MIDYDSRRWRRKSRHIRQLDGWRDVIEGWYGRAVEAKVVHHIYPMKYYPQYEWEDWNLISVSWATHNKLENRSTGELTEMGEWLMSITEPYVDWRKRRRNKL